MTTVDRLIEGDGSLAIVIRNYLDTEVGKELYNNLMEKTQWHDHV